jgi:Fe-S cluster assembly iron-binding protein IscA
MIQVTDRAAQGLAQILAAHKASKEQGIKLTTAETGELSMSIERPREGDAIVSGGRHRPLLIVDEALASRLDAAVLDLTQANGQEPHFYLLQQEQDQAP